MDIQFPRDTEAIRGTPGGASIFHGSATPIELSPESRTKANNVFAHWGNSLDQYEASTDVSAFSSKFDAFWKRQGSMEANGTDDGTKSAVRQFKMPGEQPQADR